MTTETLIKAKDARPGDLVRPNGVLCRVPGDAPPPGCIYVCFTKLGAGWGEPYPWPEDSTILLVKRADS